MADLRAATASDEFERLPFPVGQSPFRAKGVTWIGRQEYDARHVPGGGAAVVNALIDPEMRAFAQQPLLASSWYDVFPLFRLTQVAAKLCSVPHVKYLRDRAAWQAARDVRGIYKLLLRLTSPEKLAQRLVQVSSQYANFYRLENCVVSEGRMELDVTGLPRMLLDWYRAFANSFTDRLMLHAGALDMKIVLGPIEPDGQKAGVPLVRYHVTRT